MERKKSTFGSGELTLKFEDKTLLVAKKTSRSGNYHIFDATCGRIGGGFSKKGGNYLGKIMAPKGTGVDLGGGSAHHRVLVDGAKPRQVLVCVEIKILRLVCNSLVDFHTGLGGVAR